MADEKSTPIRVRALRLGFYDNLRRRPGDVFDLIPVERVVGINTQEMQMQVRRNPTKEWPTEIVSPEAQFSPEWMERVEERTPVHTSNLREAQEKSRAEIRDGRIPGRKAA